MKCFGGDRFRAMAGFMTRMLVWALLLVVLPLVPQQPTGAQGGTALRISPAQKQILQGTTAVTDIQLQNVSNLTKIEFKIGFDPNVVQVPASQMTIGGLVGGWHIHRNAVYSGAGFAEFDAFASGDPVSGSGLVASITWKGVGAGTSNLTLQEVNLIDHEGHSIAHSTGNGRIKVIANTDTPPPTDTRIPTDTPTWTPIATDTPKPPTDVPQPTRTKAPKPTRTKAPEPTRTIGSTFTPASADTATSIPLASDTPTVAPTEAASSTPEAGPAPASASISGRILLQSRTTHAGTGIYLGKEACATLLPNSPDAVTNDEGRFEIVIDSGETYQCLQALQPGFLIAESTSPQGELGTLTLPAGDLNRDNRIGTDDLDLIAEHYRSMDPVADLNADGIVDIYDLAMTSGNLGTEGPVSDWQ